MKPRKKIRAELGRDTCTALGVTARGEAPVLALCRKLIEAGLDPAMPLQVYRGDTLCLRVRSIGEAARLKVASAGNGCPVFRWADKGVTASPIEFAREAAE
jgi:hypothetical protein